VYAGPIETFDYDRTISFNSNNEEKNTKPFLSNGKVIVYPQKIKTIFEKKYFLISFCSAFLKILSIKSM